MRVSELLSEADLDRLKWVRSVIGNNLVLKRAVAYDGDNIIQSIMGEVYLNPLKVIIQFNDSSLISCSVCVRIYELAKARVEYLNQLNTPYPIDGLGIRVTETLRISDFN